MQSSSDILRITQQVQEEEIVPIKKKSTKNNVEFTLWFWQLCFCIVIVLAVILVKEISPETYQNLKEKYSSYIEQSLLLEDGDITIIDE